MNRTFPRYSKRQRLQAARDIVPWEFRAHPYFAHLFPPTFGYSIRQLAVRPIIGPFAHRDVSHECHDWQLVESQLLEYELLKIEAKLAAKYYNDLLARDFAALSRSRRRANST